MSTTSRARALLQVANPVPADAYADFADGPVAEQILRTILDEAGAADNRREPALDAVVLTRPMSRAVRRLALPLLVAAAVLIVAVGGVIYAERQHTAAPIASLPSGAATSADVTVVVQVSAVGSITQRVPAPAEFAAIAGVRDCRAWDVVPGSNGGYFMTVHLRVPARAAATVIAAADQLPYARASADSLASFATIVASNGSQPQPIACAVPSAAAAAVPADTKAALWKLALDMATGNGDPRAFAQAVATTYGAAQALLDDGTTSTPVTTPVWLVVLYGNFVCSGCSVPSGASAPTGHVITMIVPAPPVRLSDFSVGDQAVALETLGPVVTLGP